MRNFLTILTGKTYYVFRNLSGKQTTVNFSGDTRSRSTYERCDLVPRVTSSIVDSKLIIHFQEAYARLFQIAITHRVFSQTCLLAD